MYKIDMKSYLDSLRFLKARNKAMSHEKGSENNS